MVNIVSTVKAQSVPFEYTVKQHTIPQTLLLNLLPGVVITLAFILLGPRLKANHLPPMWAILLPILFVLIPMELSFLYYQGYRRNGRLSLEGIVLYRERLPVKAYFIFPLLLVAWFVLSFAALGKLDEAIFQSMFFWLPDQFNLSLFNPSEYSQPVLALTFLLILTLNGIAGPMVEELYFRGYLLPRMEWMKGWGPLVNALLFSLYHFFSPWQNITRIVALIPMVYIVSRKKNIYLSMLAHCLKNTIGAFLMIGVFFGQ